MKLGMTMLALALTAAACTTNALVTPVVDDDAPMAHIDTILLTLHHKGWRDSGVKMGDKKHVSSVPQVKASQESELTCGPMTAMTHARGAVRYCGFLKRGEDFLFNEDGTINSKVLANGHIVRW